MAQPVSDEGSRALVKEWGLCSLTFGGSFTFQCSGFTGWGRWKKHRCSYVDDFGNRLVTFAGGNPPGSVSKPSQRPKYPQWGYFLTARAVTEGRFPPIQLGGEETQ